MLSVIVEYSQFDGENNEKMIKLKITLIGYMNYTYDRSAYYIAFFFILV